MSHIYEGGIFICKACGHTHLIPIECVPDDKRRTIQLPCLYVHDEYNKYRGYEFKKWLGNWEAYSENVVKPI